MLVIAKIHNVCGIDICLLWEVGIKDQRTQYLVAMVAVSKLDKTLCRLIHHFPDRFQDRTILLHDVRDPSAEPHWCVRLTHVMLLSSTAACIPRYPGDSGSCNSLFHVWGWHSGVVGKAAACNAGIPSRYQFVSWLSHFQSHSPLKAWESSRE